MFILLTIQNAFGFLPNFEQFLIFAKVINLKFSRLKWCNFLHCDIFLPELDDRNTQLASH